MSLSLSQLPDGQDLETLSTFPGTPRTGFRLVVARMFYCLYHIIKENVLTHARTFCCILFL